MDNIPAKTAGRNEIARMKVSKTPASKEMVTMTKQSGMMTHSDADSTLVAESAVKSTTRRRKTANNSQPGYLDDETLRRMVAEAAYFIAEQRGFPGDSTLDDWLEAERQIEFRLRQQAI